MSGALQSAANVNLNPVKGSRNSVVSNRYGYVPVSLYERATASATAGAATSHAAAGVITSEALTTAAAALYTLTLTNNRATANSQVNWSVSNGTNTAGVPVASTCTPAAGSLVFKVQNNHASNAFNGTLKINYNIEA